MLAALGMKRQVAELFFALAIVSTRLPVASSQEGSGSSQATSPSPTVSVPSGNGSSAGGSISQSSLFRDPATGALYKQEIHTVDVPTTRWQTKLVDRTISIPQTVIENVQVPQTIYVPRTEYVMEQKLKGRWNPFSQPTYAYEYVPVTRWLAQTQMVTRQVSSTKIVARTEQVAVYEPVPTTEKVQRTVVTLVQPGNSSLAYPLPFRGQAYQATAFPAPANVSYGNQQPLIASVPLLSKQRVLPAWQPGTLLAAPVSAFRSIAQVPAMPTAQAGYAAPMTVATRPDGSRMRDMNQMGMPTTVVR